MKTKLITLLIVGLTALTGTATIYASGGVEPLKTRVKNWVKAEVPLVDLQDDGEELPGVLTTEEPPSEETHLRGRFCQTLVSTEEPNTDPSVEPMDIHPQVEKIVEDLELEEDGKEAEIEKISRWFCVDGYGFGKIKQAYKLSSEEGMSPDDIFALLSEGFTWGQIKQMCEEGVCDSTFTPPGLKEKNKSRGKWQDGVDDTGSELNEYQSDNTSWQNPGKGPKNKPDKPAKGPKK